MATAIRRKYTSALRDKLEEEHGIRNAARDCFDSTETGWLEFRVYLSGSGARKYKKWWYPKEGQETWATQAKRLVRDGTVPSEGCPYYGTKWELQGLTADASLSFHHWHDGGVEWVCWRLNRLLGNASLKETIMLGRIAEERLEKS